MSDDLYQQGNHPDGVRAICKECETVVLKETESEAKSTVDEHNTHRHDSEDVAGVCAWDVEPLISDEMDLGAKLAVMESLDGSLSIEEKRKVLGLVGDGR